VTKHSRLRLEGVVVDLSQDGHTRCYTRLYEIGDERDPRSTCGGAFAGDSPVDITNVMMDLSPCDAIEVVPHSEMGRSHARVNEWIGSSSEEIGLDMIPHLEDLQGIPGATLPVQPVGGGQRFVELHQTGNRWWHERRKRRECRGRCRRECSGRRRRLRHGERSRERSKEALEASDSERKRTRRRERRGNEST